MAVLLYPFHIVDKRACRERSLNHKSIIVLYRDFEEFSLSTQPTWLFSLY